MCPPRFLLASVVAALLSGCAAVTTLPEAPLEACRPETAELTLVDVDGVIMSGGVCTAKVPDIRPDFRVKTAFSDTARFAINFTSAMVTEGAPTSLPDMTAEIVVKGDSMDITVLARGISVWRIHAAPMMLRESRHPLLTSHLKARSLVRDLTLLYWPADVLKTNIAATCPDCTFHATSDNAKETRLLIRDDFKIVETLRTPSQLRLSNYPEGYVLTLLPTRQDENASPSP